MSNILYPIFPGLGYSVIKTPNFKTRTQRAVSGRTLRSADWVNPIWNFTLTYEWLDDDSAQWGRAGITYDITTGGPSYLAFGMDPADVAFWLHAGGTVVIGDRVPVPRQGAALYTITQPAGPAYIGDLTAADITFWLNLGTTVTPYAGVAPMATKVTASDLRTLMNFFNARMGSFDDFLLWDPTDDDTAGAPLIRNPADATGMQFQLVRPLALGGLNEWITAPHLVRAVYLNGQQTMGYTVDPSTGIVTFPGAIGAQVVVTADFSYYFRVTFPDTLDFENFAERFWRLKQVKLTSVPLSTAPSLCFLPNT
jgi:uncharacterized protein (TIGR02217 family)